MIISKMKIQDEHGFTLVELTIAATVFSVVLLTALAGFLLVSHLFYKGVSVSQTQEVANQVFQEINGNFQTAANISYSFNAPSGYNYYCIGNTRYTFNINKKVQLDSTPDHSPGGSYGILKDVLPGSTACGIPCSDTGGACAAGTVRLNNPTELLGDKMRVADFTVNNPSGGNLYNVSLVIAYGDDEVLGYATPGTPSTVYCKGKSAADQQFCAVSRINTAVYRGWHQ